MSKRFLDALEDKCQQAIEGEQVSFEVKRANLREDFRIRDCTFSKEEVCRHEAGHVLVCMLLGDGPVVSAKVYRLNSSQWIGNTVFQKTAESRMRTKHFGKTRLMVVMAGEIANNLSLNLDELRRELKWSIDGLMFDMLEPNVDDVANLLEQTKTLLRNHKSIFDRIADELFRREELTGQEVKELIETESS